jgi:hypothetical protein
VGTGGNNNLADLGVEIKWNVILRKKHKGMLTVIPAEIVYEIRQRTADSGYDATLDFSRINSDAHLFPL